MPTSHLLGTLLLLLPAMVLGETDEVSSGEAAAASMSPWNVLLILAATSAGGVALTLVLFCVSKRVCGDREPPAQLQSIELKAS